MAQRFFYVSGGVFFVAATIAALSLASQASQQGGRATALQYAEGGLFALTADGDTYVLSAGHWKPYANIHTLGPDPLGIIR